MTRIIPSVLFGIATTLAAARAHAETMVVGIDTKFWFDDAGGRVFKPNTGDTVLFYDLASSGFHVGYG